MQALPLEAEWVQHVVLVKPSAKIKETRLRLVKTGHNKQITKNNIGAKLSVRA